jgi:hypothetical protein
MQVGDITFYYHSNTKTPGIVLTFHGFSWKHHPIGVSAKGFVLNKISLMIMINGRIGLGGFRNKRDRDLKKDAVKSQLYLSVLIR